MKKSLHSTLSSSPAPLAFLNAVPTLTHGTRTGPSPFPRPAADSMAKIQSSPHPGVLPWAPGQPAEVPTWFSWPYQKAPAAFCARLQLQGWEKPTWPTEPNLSPKRPRAFPSPQNSSGAGKHPGWMSFSWKEVAAGRGTGRNAELPRLFPALTWEYVTYFWGKKKKKITK